MRKVMMLITTLLLGAGANAQTGGPYDLSWWTMDGGGITFATGGSFNLGGTIGQPDARNALTGGAFSLAGGFWFAPACIATNGDGDGNRCVDDADLLTVYIATRITASMPFTCKRHLLTKSQALLRTSGNSETKGELKRHANAFGMDCWVMSVDYRSRLCAGIVSRADPN